MFQTLRKWVVTAQQHNPLAYLYLPAAIYDWTRLGIFTGSRLSEYGQSKVSPLGTIRNFTHVYRSRPLGTYGHRLYLRRLYLLL